MVRAVEFILRALVQSKEVMRADFYWKGCSRGCLRSRWLGGKIEAKRAAGRCLWKEAVREAILTGVVRLTWTPGAFGEWTQEFGEGLEGMNELL